MFLRKITIVFLGVIMFFALNTESFSQCNNKVGTINKMSFVGKSTRHSLTDTVFLCWGDRFNIDHNDDYVLSDDSDASTPPGVGYAWYKSKPTSTGNKLSNIKQDDVYRLTGDSDIMVTVDNLNGDADFVNSYYNGVPFSQKYPGLGNPALVYYAPITVDKRVGRRGYYEKGDNSCVNANPNESFSVVYLNPIEIKDVQYGTGVDSFKVTFKVVGGLPEYYAEKGIRVEYTDITVLNVQNPPSSNVDILTPGFSHGESVSIRVSEFEKYNVIIQDGVSCFSEQNIIVSKKRPPVVTIDTVYGNQGDRVCLGVNGMNFDSITEGLCIINFDPKIVNAPSISNPIEYFTIELPDEQEEPGKLRLTWRGKKNKVAIGPNESKELFAICFDLVGEPGECTEVSTSLFQLTSDLSYIRYIQTDEGTVKDTVQKYAEYYPEVGNGLACIDLPPDLYASFTRCGPSSAKNDGSISFKIFNGTPPYSYTVKKGAKIIETGTVFVAEDVTTTYGLRAGTYTIEIKDKDDNVFTLEPITVVDPPLEFETVDVTPVRCFSGYCEGAISVKVAKIGGIQAPNYSIKWSNGVYGQDYIEELCNGSYGVTITDQYGCETDTFIVLNTTKLVGDVKVEEKASCEGVRDGKVRIDISGGTPKNGGYKVTWNSEGPQVQKSGVTSHTYDQALGLVHWTIEDANRCREEGSLTIDSKYKMEVESVVTDVTCNGQNDGTASFKVDLVGATDKDFNMYYPVYPFPPQIPEKIGIDSFIIKELGGGELIVRLIETNTKCAVNDTVEIKEPDAITFIKEQVGEYCCGDDPFFLPSVKIAVTKGNFPITLDGLGEIITLNSKGEHYYDGLVEGSYSVLATDANSCDTVITFDIVKAEGCLSIDTIKYDELGCDALATTDIVVEAKTNFGNITYTWIDGNTGDTIKNPSNVLSNVGVGKYVVEVKDNGCAILDTIELKVALPYTVTSDILPAECAFGEKGGDLGKACVNVDGGNAGYSFLWDDGSTNNCRDLVAGRYPVTISDGKGCNFIDTVVVGGPSPIVLDYLDIDDVSCNDGKTEDGKVIVSASGGNNPTGLYNFSFNGAPNQVGKMVSYENLAAGKNYITVSYNTVGGHSCILEDSIEIGLPDKVEIDHANSSLVKPSCYGDCDGKIVLQAKGGNPNLYNYHWQEKGVDGSVQDNLCADTYHILIRDANNCEVLDSVILEQPEELVLVIDSAACKGINCTGSESGEIKVKHSGGNESGEFTYVWSPDVSNTSFAEKLGPGFYSITVTDEKGCSDFVGYEIKEQEPISFTPLQQDTIKCYGDKTCIYLDSVFGGAGAQYTFSVDGGNIMSVDSCIEVYGSTTPYLVSVFDSEGCREDKQILVSQPQEIIVDLGDKLEINLGENGTVYLNTNTSVSNIVWDIDTLLVDYKFLNQLKTELEISASSSTTIYATVESLDGCTATGKLEVKVNTVRNVRVPNIFTPDGDGLNEEFNIAVGKGVKKVNYIKIYDRYGGLMFEEKDLLPSGGSVGSWDGTYKGSKVNTGVYVYMVEVEFLDNRVILYRGSVTVVR